MAYNSSGKNIYHPVNLDRKTADKDAPIKTEGLRCRKLKEGSSVGFSFS